MLQALRSEREQTVRRLLHLEKQDLPGRRWMRVLMIVVEPIAGSSRTLI